MVFVQARERVYSDGDVKDRLQLEAVEGIHFNMTAYLIHVKSEFCKPLLRVFLLYDTGHVEGGWKHRTLSIASFNIDDEYIQYQFHNL